MAGVTSAMALQRVTGLISSQSAGVRAAEVAESDRTEATEKLALAAGREPE
jgi:hypothetical protein